MEAGAKSWRSKEGQKGQRKIKEAKVYELGFGIIEKAQTGMKKGCWFFFLLNVWANGSQVTGWGRFNNIRSKIIITVTDLLHMVFSYTNRAHLLIKLHKLHIRTVNMARKGVNNVLFKTKDNKNMNNYFFRLRHLNS